MWSKRLIKMLENTGFDVVFSKDYPLGKIYLNHELILYVNRITRDFKNGVFYFYGFNDLQQPVAMILKTRRGAIIIEKRKFRPINSTEELVYQEMLARMLEIGGRIAFEKVEGGYVGEWELMPGVVFRTPPQPTIGAVLWSLDEALESQQLPLLEGNTLVEGVFENGDE